MNPITDVAVRQVAAETPKRGAAVRDAASTQSVRQEGAAVDEARESAAEEQAQVREARLQQAIEQINIEARGLSPALKFEPNTETGVVVIKVLNRETGEVIRQLPPEAVVKAVEDGSALPSLVDTSA